MLTRTDVRRSLCAQAVDSQSTCAQVQALHEQLSEAEEQNARLQLQANQRPSISPVVASFNPSLRNLPHSYLAPVQQGALHCMCAQWQSSSSGAAF